MIYFVLVALTSGFVQSDKTAAPALQSPCDSPLSKRQSVSTTNELYSAVDKATQGIVDCIELTPGRYVLDKTLPLPFAGPATTGLLFKSRLGLRVAGSSWAVLDGNSRPNEERFTAFLGGDRPHETEVHMDNINITGGALAGIYNPYGSLIMKNCSVFNNGSFNMTRPPTAFAPAGICNGGRLTMQDAIVTDNFHGHGIYDTGRGEYPMNLIRTLVYDLMSYAT